MMGFGMDPTDQGLTGKEGMTTATATPNTRHLPPVLGRLFRGTFWLALRTPLQAIFTFWTARLILDAVGKDANGAYNFAWAFGFLQFLLEFGIGSALQREISDCWTRGDRKAVDRAIACGMSFYAVMALVQVAALMGLAYWAVPHSEFHVESKRLIVKLLWLQAITAPCYGLSMVVSSVLQAARRYDFIPRYEVAIVILRFAILWAGVRYGLSHGFRGSVDFFFFIVIAQTATQIILSLGPAIWVMARELGHVPHFGGVRLADFAPLLHVSFFMFLIQLSVVLADKIDATILGFVLPDPGLANSIYGFVSKPFVQIRQTGWMLASMVMPAVASLAAARDTLGLEKMKYDGPRLHIGVILPVALLAWIYAAPFLSLWVGDRLGYDAGLEAPRMRLFLVATIPLMIAVHVQMAIGMNHIAVIAYAALGGSVVNLAISYLLTRQLQSVDGVILGTVLTTLFSNFLIPGIYVFRVLKVRLRTYVVRTLSAPAAGALALVAVTWVCRTLAPIELRGETVVARSVPLLAHLSAGCVAYLLGYLCVPAGFGDFSTLVRKLRGRVESRVAG
jgi:hypothetical protein